MLNINYKIQSNLLVIME